MSNTPIELLISLGVNDTPTRNNINSYIKSLQKSLNGISDLSINLNLKGFESQFQQSTSKVEKQARESGKKIAESFSFAGNMRKARQETNKELKKQGREFYNNQNEMIEKLRKFDPKLTVTYVGDTDEIKKVTAKIKESDNIVKTVTYKPVVIEAQGTKKSGKGFASLPDETATDTTTHNLQQNLEKTRQKLAEVEHQGTLANSKIKEFRSVLDGIKNNEELTKLNKDIKDVTSSTSREIEIIEKSARVYKEREEALAQLIRLEKQFKKTLDYNESAKIRENLKSVPYEGFANLQQIKEASSAVSSYRTQIRTLAADATEATKNSMGVVDAFKVAMERFPVWMAASTAFYGTVRSIRSAVTQIVDIDSQLTVLKRVSNGQLDVNRTLEESIALAKQLGNEIQDVNNGFIEFARQGYRGDELTQMTEYATLLGNISDMDVSESSSILTAALKGFNKEASEGIRVVDALNEVDNNYAINSKQLAEALQRSAGAAYTYGVSMEKSIGYTTAIGEVTRESGSVIGKVVADVKSFLIDLELLTA